MDISTDQEIYMLAQMAERLDSAGAGAELLKAYWMSIGKIKYTPLLLGSGFTFTSKEIPYLLNVETTCERLLSVLHPFLRSACCAEREGQAELEPIVKQASARLVAEMERLQTVTLHYGWERLVETFASMVFRIEETVTWLMSAHSSGKRVRICTNAMAEDFLRPMQLDFRSRSGKYFLFQQ